MQQQMSSMDRSWIGSPARERSPRRKLGQIALALALGAWLVAAPPAQADSAAQEAGLGVAAALGTLLYGPVKVVFASTGVVVSGMAWLWTGGDSDVAKPILVSSVRGDYVVTPSHLRGRRPLEFIGREPSERRAEWLPE